VSEEPEVAGEDEAESDAGDALDSARVAFPPVPLAKAGAVAAAVTVFAAIATQLAFSPERSGSPTMALAPGLLYLVLAALAALRLRGRGELAAALTPRGGDLTIGALGAGLLYAGGMAGRLLLAPAGSAEEAWVIRVVLHMGDPSEPTIHVLAAAVLVTAALEEVAWRGLVMPLLADSLGGVRGWLVTTGLYGLAHVPSLWLLSDVAAGPNPGIVGAALAGGFVWGYMALRFQRLGPAVFAHALFSWAMVEFPLWRLG
jgi:membrane protease YdiL (CAAX protease family)